MTCINFLLVEFHEPELNMTKLTSYQNNTWIKLTIAVKLIWFYIPLLFVACEFRQLDNQFPVEYDLDIIEL